MGGGEEGSPATSPNLPAPGEGAIAARLSPHPATLWWGGVRGGERAAGDCLPLNARADLSVFQDVDVGVEKPRREGGVMARPEGALIWTRSQAPHSPKSSSSLLLLAAGPTPAGLRVPAQPGQPRPPGTSFRD